jgi:hypothetical protein
MGRLYFGQVSLLCWNLPVPEWTKLSQDFGNFLYFIEYITYRFGIKVFSLSNAYDSQIWSSEGVTEFLHMPFTAFELFD